MSDLETFGSLIIPTAVEDAAQATLEQWLETYLEWVCRLLGKSPGWLPKPRSWVVTSDFNHFPEEATPAVLIVSPGITHLERDGKRDYRGRVQLTVGVVVDGPNRSATERLAKFYAAAIRAVLVQKGSLGGVATATVWSGEKYGVRDADRSQRTFGTAEVEFDVEVRELVRGLSGPITVPAKPSEAPPNNPTVSSGGVTIKPF